MSPDGGAAPFRSLEDDESALPPPLLNFQINPFDGTFVGILEFGFVELSTVSAYAPLALMVNVPLIETSPVHKITSPLHG